MTDSESGPRSAVLKVDRRDFLAAAGAGTLLGAFSGAASAQPLQRAAGDRWDAEAEVIVVGSGAAGGAAAARALDLGRSVLIVEKSPSWGGTTAKSAGGYWVLNNSLMRAKGIEDPREDALRLMARMAFPALYDREGERFGLPTLDYALLETFYDRGSDAIDNLARMGALRSMLWADENGDPQLFDYGGHLPENKAPLGRCLRPQRSDGQPGLGGDIARQLYDYLQANGANMLLAHRAAAAIVDADGQVIGIEAASSAGTRYLRAHRGVVFASGGFTHDARMREDFLRGDVFGGCAVPTNEGDFVRIGQSLGASYGNMKEAWWGQLLVEHALQSPSVGQLLFHLPGKSMLLVNRFGVRVVDETVVYNERARAHFQWDPHTYDYPNRILLMLWDRATHEESAGRLPIPSAGATATHVLSADTLNALADRIDTRLRDLGARIRHFRLAEDFTANLRATIARFNGFAAAGRDADFHRGEHPWGWFATQGFGAAPFRTGAPGATMRPLASSGPYYAALLGAGTLDTNGGPRTNVDAQIVRADDTPIAGLYGAGNCTASIAGQAYFSGGSTLGPALVFGYIAGEHAAQAPSRATA